MINKELEKQARTWANNIIERFKTKEINILRGEEKKLYDELEEWNWFQLCPLSDDNPILSNVLTAKKYAILKWQKDHPQVKRTPWQMVTGRVR
jgi:hypothetical protein